MKVKREREVAQSCPTLCDPMDCSLPGSSVHGIFQARVLEWGASAFSIWVYTQRQFIKNPIKCKRGGRLQTKGTPCRIPVHNTEKKGRVLEVMSIFHPACLRACCLISGSSAEPHDFSLLEKHPLAPNWAPIQSWSLVHHAALCSVFLSPVGD